MNLGVLVEFTADAKGTMRRSWAPGGGMESWVKVKTNRNSLSSDSVLRVWMVCPASVEGRLHSTADQRRIDGRDGMGAFVPAPGKEKLHHRVATRAKGQAHCVTV